MLVRTGGLWNLVVYYTLWEEFPLYSEECGVGLVRGVCIFWSMDWMENASFVGHHGSKYDLYESIVHFLLGDM